MIKRPFNPDKIKEDIHFQLKGTLRIRIYLYMEDNDCTMSEAIRDCIRVSTTRQEDERKKGRKPLS